MTTCMPGSMRDIIFMIHSTTFPGFCTPHEGFCQGHVVNRASAQKGGDMSIIALHELVCYLYLSAAKVHRLVREECESFSLFEEITLT